MSQDEDRISELRRLRNSTFHYQKDWMGEKFMQFMTGTGVASWVRGFHKAVGETILLARIATVEGDKASQAQQQLDNLREGV